MGHAEAAAFALNGCGVQYDLMLGCVALRFVCVALANAQRTVRCRVGLNYVILCSVYIYRQPRQAGSSRRIPMQQAPHADRVAPPWAR